MKKIKLLFMAPTLVACAGSSFATLANCSCNQTTDLTLELISDKKKFTERAEASNWYAFKMNKHILAKDFTATATQTEGTYTGSLSTSCSVSAEETLIVTVYFENSVEPGQYSKFNLNIKADGQEFNYDLELWYRGVYTPIPDSAYQIEDGELKSIDTSIDTEPYDTIMIPDSVTKIADGVFKDYATTTSHNTIVRLVFNAKLTTIGANAFEGCNNINFINVSNTLATNSITSIGENAFDGWQENGTIYYDLSVTSNDNIDFQLYDAGLPKSWLANISRAIPESDFIIDGTVLKGFVETLPKHLDLCDTLKVPASITEVGEKAFGDLTTTKIPSTVTKLTFASTDTLTTINNYAFANAPIAGAITFPTTVKSIGNYAFYQCASISEMNLSETKLSTIGDYAFNSCTSITHLKFPNSVTSYGSLSFAKCTNLNSIDVTLYVLAPVGISGGLSFTGVAETGVITCQQTQADSWKTWFADQGIKFTNWSITDRVELASYDRASEIPAQTEVTTKASAAELMSLYHEKTNANAKIWNDDMYHTLFARKKAYEASSGETITRLNVKISGTTIPDDSSTATFTIYYSYQKGEEADVYDGSIAFTNIPFGNMDGNLITESEDVKYWDLTDTVLTTEQEKGWSISINEYNYTQQSEPVCEEVIITRTSLTTMTWAVSTVGNLMYDLGIVDHVNGSWNLHSFYLQNVAKGW